MIVELSICIRVLLKHEPLDILTWWVLGRDQESSHYIHSPCASRDQGPMEMLPGQCLEDPSSLFLTTHASSLLMLWEPLSGGGVCAYISIYSVLREREARVPQWRADTLAPPQELNRATLERFGNLSNPSRVSTSPRRLSYRIAQVSTVPWWGVVVGGKE